MANKTIVKRIAELVDGDAWILADLLVEVFPPEEFGEAGSSATTGLHAELEEYQTELATEYGVELKANTMRRYRTTALAWPRDRRRSRASFAAHKELRGENRFKQMDDYLGRMGGQALSPRHVRRFKSQKNRTKQQLPDWSDQVRRQIDALTKRLVLGEGVKVKRDDWWNAAKATDERCDIVISALRSVANDIKNRELR